MSVSKREQIPGSVNQTLPGSPAQLPPPHSILIFFSIFFLVLNPFPEISLSRDEGNQVLDSPGEPNPLWSRIPRDLEAGINKQKRSGPVW